MTAHAAVPPVLRARYGPHRIEFEGEGQLSRAWRIDDELVVRVPKHAFGVERLRFETRLLDALAPLLVTRVPEVVEVALDAPVGEAFVAHRRLPGRVLRRREIEAMPHDRVDTIGRQIGVFLREMHAVDLASVEVPVLPPAAFAARLQREVEELLAPRIARAHVDESRRALAEIAALPNAPVVLAHTDIGGNVLIDDDGTVAVVDFGSCFATYPAFDLASLSVLGDEILRAAAASYDALTGWRRDADVIAASFVLQDALYGARQADWNYVATVFADD